MTAADRPTVPHPDLDTLADLDAGVLDPAAAGDVAAHVGGCARCTEAMAAFDAVRADLGALPTPPMPPAVAARLDATLADLRRGAADPAAGPAAEPAADPAAGTAGAGAAAAGSAPPRHPRPPADLSTARERRRRRGLKIGGGAVAAAFVLVAAGASVTALVTSAGNDTATTAGSGGGAAANSLSGEAAAPGASRSDSSDTLAGGVLSYTKETLRDSLASITRESAVTDVSRLGETGPAGEMADPARRQACERSIALRQGRLTAVRRIDYEGTPAYVFVFTDAAGRQTAWVVDTTCGTTGGLPATVLDSVS